ncbi:ATP-binding protein [Azospirillum doebereinerae]|uniref:histidine kinase n=1 Tax=Azospirillum doebereinerae TaxID=92933 RepID=A0A3S0VI69_9PROT|nr:ATP-binding protein [Azospirillum doebereinerae]RUQ70794.1 DUF4118 domain-containing protein [Azospirillum doebereinerae]
MKIYAIALAIVLAAAILRLGFLLDLGLNAPFVTFYPAVMLAALYGGLRAGAVATVSSALIADYFWIEPVGALIPVSMQDWVVLSLFVITNILVSCIAENLQKANIKLQDKENNQKKELENQVYERTSELEKQIIERKHAEESLAESENRFRTLANAIPQLAFIAHADGHVHWYNERWYQYTGETPESMEGWGWKSVHHPDVLPAVMERWLTSIATRNPFDMTFPLRGADGQFRPFLTRVMPLLDSEGRVMEWFGTNTELSEQISMENDLRKAKVEAERANLAKSKFLAAVSHDLRQPVQSLVLLLEVLKTHRDGSKVTKAIEAMGGALNGLNDLLKGTLDISRIDAGVVTVELCSVDVRAMLKRLSVEYAPLSERKGLKFRYFCKAGRHAHTDGAILERIIRNLVENAIRYTNRGGLLIGVRPRGDRMRIEIVDTGIGIPADKIGEIYEEFFQVGNPARDHRLGLGLGLAIVRRCARLLDVELQVRSNEGRGTRFTILLPLDGSVPVAPAPSIKTRIAGGARIMIIEDNPKIRTGFQMLLECWDYEVFCAETGEISLTVGEQEGWRFDAIIADHRLGAGMSGTETAAEIRRRAKRPIPTLIVTGDTSPERIEEVHASGFEMLHKPVAPDALARRMAILLQAAG